MKTIILFLILFPLLYLTTHAQNEPEYKVIKTFSGSGIQNTAPFTVNSNEWKVEYKSTANNTALGAAGHLLQVYLLEPGQQLYQGQIVANQANKKVIEGESYVYKSGRFYFNSNSANGDWEIKVLVPLED